MTPVASWLDSILYRATTCMTGSDQEFAKGLCADNDFLEKVKKYFAGTMLDARRLLGPPDEDAEECESSDGED